MPHTHNLHIVSAGDVQQKTNPDSIRHTKSGILHTGELRHFLLCFFLYLQIIYVLEVNFDWFFLKLCSDYFSGSRGWVIQVAVTNCMHCCCVRSFMYVYLSQHQRRRAFVGHTDERVIQSDQHSPRFDVNRRPSACRANSLVSTSSTEVHHIYIYMK